MSGQQTTARNWVRSHWQELLYAVVEDALREAQEDDAAARLAARLWPAMPVDDVIRLDKADRFLRRRGPAAVPEGFAARLQERLAKVAQGRIAAALPGNKYAGGRRFLEILRQEVVTVTNIDRSTDWAFRERDTDDFTRPHACVRGS